MTLVNSMSFTPTGIKLWMLISIRVICYSQILDLSRSCVLTREVTIKPYGTPWITTLIKSKIRKRKKYYRKAKRT